MANILDAYKENHDEAVVDSNRKMRVAIIGCGWIADAHMASYLKQPDVEIVAGCDIAADGQLLNLPQHIGAQGCAFSNAELLAHHGFQHRVGKEHFFCHS